MSNTSTPGGEVQNPANPDAPFQTDESKQSHKPEKPGRNQQDLDVEHGGKGWDDQPADNDD